MKRAIAAAAVTLTMIALPAMAQGKKATADLQPTAGNNVKGSVTFTQQGDKVMVMGMISGLAPGKHGFHVHEKGDCSAPDGMSAGGHFNPTAKPHGDPAGAEHHAGDMPQIDADAAGNASVHATLTGVSIGSGATDIVGHGLIVHKDADDYKTQPTGNAGARVACAVIK